MPGPIVPISDLRQELRTILSRFYSNPIQQFGRLPRDWLERVNRIHPTAGPTNPIAIAEAKPMASSAESRGSPYEDRTGEQAHWLPMRNVLTNLPLAPPLWLRLPDHPLPSAADLAGLIYAQYSFPEGEKRLAGFTIQYRPSFLVSRHPLEQLLESPTMDWNCFDFDGQPVRQPSWNSDQLWSACRQLAESHGRTLDTAWSRAYAEQLPGIQPTNIQSTWEAIAVGAPFGIVVPEVWLEGKVVFRFDEQEVETRFSLKHQTLISNPARIAPYRCPLSGDSGYSLTVDAEGDIGVVSSLEPCSKTGKAFLRFKMARCANTGRWACRSQMVPTSGQNQWLLPEAMTTCRKCSLIVAQRHLVRGVCQDCHSLIATENDSQLGEQNRELAATLVPQPWRGRPKTATSGRVSRLQILAADGVHLLLFDELGQLVVHRLRPRWRWNWQTVANPQQISTDPKR